MYCFDTDVLSAIMRPDPPLDLIRRLSAVPLDLQFTTAITVGELLYGAARRRSVVLADRIARLIEGSLGILPFDADAAGVYGSLRASLEKEGRRLDEPDLRIASIVLARDMTLVSGNVRHFARVPDLQLENWLAV
jgi:tRNA(fMet)-specific endonuclease VapC